MTSDMMTSLIAVLAPLVGVPLTIITFYLRSLRDDQLNLSQEFRRRVESLDTSAADLRRTMRSFEREYTSKEEWLREYMQTRRQLEQLTHSIVRVESIVQMLLPEQTKE